MKVLCVLIFSFFIIQFSFGSDSLSLKRSKEQKAISELLDNQSVKGDFLIVIPDRPHLNRRTNTNDNFKNRGTTTRYGEMADLYMKLEEYRNSVRAGERPTANQFFMLFGFVLMAAVAGSFFAAVFRRRSNEPLTLLIAVIVFSLIVC